MGANCKQYARLFTDLRKKCRPKGRQRSFCAAMWSGSAHPTGRYHHPRSGRHSVKCDLMHQTADCQLYGALGSLSGVYARSDGQFFRQTTFLNTESRIKMCTIRLCPWDWLSFWSGLEGFALTKSVYRGKVNLWTQNVQVSRSHWELIPGSYTLDKNSPTGLGVSDLVLKNEPLKLENYKRIIDGSDER